MEQFFANQKVPYYQGRLYLQKVQQAKNNKQSTCNEVRTKQRFQKIKLYVFDSLGVTMGDGKSNSVDVEQQKTQLLNENQETPSSYFEVDADFFDLSDPEKQKDVDPQRR